MTIAKTDRSRKNAVAKRRPALMLALEPRLMYDGAAVATAANHTVPDAHAAPDASARALIPNVPAPVEVREADPSKDNGKKEVTFIDTSISNWQALAANAAQSNQGMEIELIGGGQSGLAQIATWAQSHSGYDAIHIVSPGAQGQLAIGSDRVTDATLATAVAQAEAAEIGSALKDGGSILLYGSNIAGSADGQRFIDDLARDTGATVLASTKAVGTAQLGGDWSLDASTGESAAMAISLGGYDGLLGIGDVAISGTHEAEMIRAADPSLDGGKTEIAFIDASVTDYQTLIGDVRAGVEIVVISGQDGLEQIAAYLQGRTGVSAIHLLSHGDSGTFVFGHEDVNVNNVAAYEATLAAIGNSLTADGDMLLYGCDVAAGPSGETLVDRISSYTKADVAASTDLTGAAGKGGNWDLEFHVGAIDVATAISATSGADYKFVLNTYTFTDLTDRISTFSQPSISLQYHDLTITETDLEEYSLPTIFIGPSNGDPFGHEMHGLLGEGSGAFVNQSVDITKTDHSMFSVSSIDVFGGLGTTYLGESGTYEGISDAQLGFNGYDIVIQSFDASNHLLGSTTVHITNTASVPVTVDLSHITGFTNISDIRVTAEGAVGIGNLVMDAPVVTPPPPTVISINRNGGSDAPTNATDVSYNVTFSEAVTGVTVSNFSLSGGAGAISGISTSDHINYLVTVTGATGDGALGLNLSFLGGIQDGAAQALTGTHTSDQTFTLDHTAPVISNLDGDSAVYVAGATPTLLDQSGNAAVTETHIGGGTLTVSIDNNQSAEDVIGLKTGTGAITTSGSGTVTIFDNGTEIGSYSSTGDGHGGRNLVVTLKAGDTTAQVADLIHALTYSDTSSSPNAAARTVRVALTDSAGNVSSSSTSTVAIDRVPTVTAGHTVSVVRSGAAAAFDGSIAVSDADSDWNGGSLVVQITGNADTAHDSLTLPTSSSSSIWLNGTALMFGATQIGTASASSATGGTAWTFNLNANATNAEVTQLADTIQLSVTGGGSLSDRTVSFTAKDSHGATGTVATDTVKVLAEPTISGGSSHSVNDNGSIHPFGDVTITDGTSEGVDVTISFQKGDGVLGVRPGWIQNNSDPSIVTYTASFVSVAAANAELAALTFVPAAHTGNVGTSQTVTFSVSAKGQTTQLVTGTNTSSSAVITYVNEAPFVSAGSDGASTYTVGGSAVTIDAGITINDLDNAGNGNWSGGFLLVNAPSGGDTAHDQLSIAGTADISVDAGVVTYGGVEIGTIHAGSTGAPGTNLRVDLNGNATNAAVQALARAIQFSDNGLTTNGSDRTIAIIATDGSGVGQGPVETVHMRIGPVVTSIVPTAGTDSPTNHDSVSFDVTFSEAVTGVTAADFSLSGTDPSHGSITSVVSNADGTVWTVTVTGISGDGTVQLDQTDTVGVKDGNDVGMIGTHSGDQGVTIDTTPPVMPTVDGLTTNSDSGGSSSDGVTSNTTPTVTGTAEANSFVTLYDSDGATVLGSVQADAGGHWSITSSGLSEGTHALKVTATDTAGNVSTISTALSVTIDTTAPSMPGIDTTITSDTGSSPTDGVTNDSMPTLTGTAEAGSVVKLYDTDGTTLLGTVTADGSGHWSITSSTLGDGTHDLKVTATDTAGNVSTISTALSVTIDTSAPTQPGLDATITSDTGSSSTDGITSDTTPTLTGTAEAGSIVTLYDTDGTTQLGTATADGSGHWSIASSALGDGIHDLKITATDTAGNVSTTSAALSVSIDSTPPVATVETVSFSADSGTDGDFVTHTAAQTISGTLSASLADGETVQVSLDDGAHWTTAMVGAGSTTWTLAGQTLSSSDTLQVRVVDTAGNAGTALVQAYVLDMTAPAVPGIDTTITSDTGSSSTDGITSDTTPALTGTAEAGSTVTLYDTDGTTQLGMATADGDGHWSITSSALGDGTHDLKVTATDMAGNVSTMSTALSVTIDASAPTQPGIDATITSDTGASQSDSITSDTTPTLTGTAEVGSTVTLYDTDGLTMLGTATADGAGHWSITSTALGDGVHDLKITATDTAGNVSTMSTALSVTIDTTAPTMPAIDATITSDTGASMTDGMTSDATPTLTGTAEVGSVVKLYDTDGTTLLGTVTADGSGHWSITSSTLGDGTHGLKVTATDTAGNVSTISTALSVTIDTSAPTQPGLDATITSDTGNSSTDGITSDTTPTLTGTAEAGSTVTLYDTDGLTTLGTAVADGSGHWRITSSTLGDGAHDLKVTATDMAGNVSTASVALSVTIDATAPTMPVIDATITSDTGSSSTDGITSDTTPTLTGTAEAGSTVTLYDTDGTTALGTATADGAGHWSITSSTLAGGVHSLKVKATDTAGNVSTASAALSVTVDTTAPTMPVIAATITSDTGNSSTDGITSDTTPTLTGTAEAGSTVTLYDTDGLTTLGTEVADDNGHWSITSSTLDVGVHSLKVKATDTAGNVSTASTALSVTIDTTAPIMPVIAATITSDTGSSSTDGITSDKTPTLTGMAEVGSTVTLYDTDGLTMLGTAVADGSGHWSITSSTLAGGTHDLKVTATDTAGNVSTASNALSVTVDTTAPTAPVIDATIASDTGSSQADGITSDTTPTLTGTAEVGSIVKLYDTDGVTLLGTATADGSGHWSITSSALAGGVHGLKVTATDTAGNVSTASTALSVTIDTAAPTAPVIDSTITSDTGNSSTDNITSDTTPTLTGTAEAGSTVTLYDTDGLTELGSATADGSGHWSITSSMLAGGAHSLKVKATDTAGNVSTASTALSVTIDTAAPITPVIAAAITSDTGSSSTDGITSDTTPTLTGTAEAGSTVTLYDTDGLTKLGTATADGSGHWSITSSALAGGAHSLKVTATDTAGNVSTASNALSVTVDTTAPTAPVIDATITSDTGSSQSDGITRDTTPTLTGTAEVGSIVKLYDTDGTTLLGTATADGSGHWSITSSALAGGVHGLKVMATDTAGNVSTASIPLSVTIDTMAPIAPVIDAAIASDTGSSSTDRITSDTTPTLTGTAEAGSTVTLYDTDGLTTLGTAVADGNGHWSITSSTLAGGVHSLKVKATDTAGNVSTASAALSVTIDTTAPTTPIISATITSDTGSSQTDGITSDTTPTLTGTAEAGSAVTLYDTDGLTLLGTAVADGNGHWSITSSALAGGVHDLKVTATDTAGNVSTASAALSVTIDTTAPSMPSIDATITPDTGASMTDGVTNNTTPTLTGMAEAGSTVTLYDTDGTTVLGTATADGSGHWSITSSALAEGIHHVTAKATDAAGNVSVQANQVVVTVDRSVSPPTFAVGTDTGSSNTDNLTSDGAVNVTLASDVASWRYSVDGGNTWTVGAGSSFTLAAGTYATGKVLVEQTDIAGNVSSRGANTAAITIDQTAPVTPTISLETDSGQSDTDHITNDGTLDVGNLEAGASWQYSADGGSTWTSASGALHLPGSGSQTLQVRQTDAAGNVGAASAPFTYLLETTGPALGLSFDAGATRGSLPTLTGTVSDAQSDVENVFVTLKNGDVTMTLAATVKDGTWSATADTSLNEGAWTVVVLARNAAGNETTVTSGITVFVPKPPIQDVPPSKPTSLPPLPPMTDSAADTPVLDAITVGPAIDPIHPGPGGDPFTLSVPDFVPISVAQTEQQAGQIPNGFTLSDVSSLVAVATTPADHVGTDPLLAASALGDMQAQDGKDVAVQLPPGLFESMDPKTSVNVDAVQADGSPLPTWLHFDVRTGKFSGVPPAGAKSLSIKVTARDGKGHEVSAAFDLKIADSKGAAKPAPRDARPEPHASANDALRARHAELPIGRLSLARQFDRHGSAGMQHDRAQLIKHLQDVVANQPT